jgi:NAD(P)-dependent dehydrogenase (short-subunit alcohol dehydrogenase family)
MEGEQVTIPRTPSFRLDGKRALVTGAGRGIGLALAAALAEAGAQVTLCSRTAAEVEAGAAAIKARGGSSDALVLDVADVAAVRRAIAGLPPFDILVNNAGGNRPAPFLDVTEDDFDALMRLNVRAAFFTAQAVAARMAAAGTRGSIINISSQAGRVAAAGRSVYTTSKFAIEGLTKVMAVELAPKGIRVNSICPTFIETDMTRPSLDDPGFRNFVLSKIKLGRLGAVEDLMGAVVFLASDASSLMTGSSLVVDGGWTAG